MGKLTYAPLDAIPTLSDSMLLILSLLLMVVALRVAKNKNTSKLLVTFLALSAITLGSGGFKIVTDVIAASAVLDKPEGGKADILELQANDYKNISGVTLQITGVDISTISCEQYQGGSSLDECAPGKILNNNESCNIDCSPTPPRGVIQFASATYGVLEDGGSVTVELTRTGGSAGAIDVLVSTLDGTAEIGMDYSGLAAPFSLSWPDGNTTPKTITFPILSDATAESNETFTVELAAADPGVLGPVTSTEVTIVEASTSGVIQFASAAYTVAEDAGFITVELNRTGGSAGAISIDITSLDGTAEDGTDYNGIPTPLTLTWPDGNTVTRTVTFPVIPDAVAEPNETFTAHLTATDPGLLGPVTSTEVTITDVPPGVIQFASAAYTVAEDAGFITVELIRTGGSAGAISIDISSLDGTAEGGTDYNGIPTPLTLTWPDGNTVTRTVTFPVIPDAVAEPNETFTAHLTATDPGLLGSVTSTEITITDVPPGVIQFASAAYTVAENAGFITVELIRTGGSAGAISIDISSLDGTAEGGTDYNGIPTPLTLTWPDGNTVTRTVTFPVIPDAVAEPNETFTAHLTATDPGLLGPMNSTEVTIIDVSGPSRGVIQFASTNYMVSEGAGFITVEVTRVGGSAGAISFDISSLDGTAEAGADYNGIATPLTLTWPDGNTVPRTVTFPIIPDVAPEPNETFTVELSVAAADSGVLGTVTSTEVTITDVPPGVVQFTSTDYVVSEADGFVTVEVTRTGASAGAISIDISSLDGTAEEGTDYNGITTPLTLTWPDGNTVPRTVTFPVIPDVVAEPNETFSAHLSATDPGLLGPVASTKVTITNVPSPPPGIIQFASAAYIVAEDAGFITVEVTRTGGSAGAIDVQVSSLDGTAEAGTDYNGIPTPLTLTWPDGNTVPRTITFPILPDAVPEPNETFTVELAAAAVDFGVLGSVTSTEIIITNTPPP